MTKRMLRHVIPIDGQPHVFRLHSDPVLLAGRPDGDPNRAEFWALSDQASFSVQYTLQVFGTGEPVPDSARFIATSVRVGGDVWHLFDVTRRRPPEMFPPVRVEGDAEASRIATTAAYRAAIREAIFSYPEQVDIASAFSRDDLATWIADETLKGK